MFFESTEADPLLAEEILKVHALIRVRFHNVEIAWVEYQMLSISFYAIRCIVVTRRAKYIVKEIEDRLHIVEGFLKAMKSMGKIIDTIRNANDSADARSKLTSLYDLSHKQASSVLDLPLVRLTSIETKKLQAVRAKPIPYSDSFEVVTIQQ